MIDGMRNAIVIPSLYRLGDQLYDLAFAAALRRQGVPASIAFVTSPATHASPLIAALGWERIEVPAPWLSSGWWRHVRPLASGFRGIVRSGREFGPFQLWLDPRAGLPEQLAGWAFMGVRKVQYRPSTRRSMRARALGYHEKTHYGLSR